MSELSPQEAQARLKLQELERRSRLVERVGKSPGHLWRAVYILGLGVGFILLQNLPSEDGWSVLRIALFVCLGVVVFLLGEILHLERRFHALVELLRLEGGLDPARVSDTGTESE